MYQIETLMRFYFIQDFALLLCDSLSLKPPYSFSFCVSPLSSHGINRQLNTLVFLINLCYLLWQTIFLKLTVIFRDLVDRELNEESKCNFLDRGELCKQKLSLVFDYRTIGLTDPRVKTLFGIQYWGQTKAEGLMNIEKESVFQKDTSQNSGNLCGAFWSQDSDGRLVSKTTA